jgi:hypothetical protein
VPKKILLNLVAAKASNYIISQVERNLDILKIASVLIEIRSRQVYCTNTIFVTAETTCLLAVFVFLRKEGGKNGAVLL